MQNFRDIARTRLQYNEDPTGTVNNYQRINKSKDFIINVGPDVYGVFNNLQNTIGYDQKNHYSILSGGIHNVQCNTKCTKTQEYNLITDAYGFKWQGKCFNPSLLNTPLLHMSEKMIGNLINICNNVQGLPSVSQTDINTVDVFTVEPSGESPVMNAIKKTYPILNNLKWKTTLPTSVRGDLGLA